MTGHLPLRPGDALVTEWRCLVRPGKRMKPGRSVSVAGITGTVTEVFGNGDRLIPWDAPVDLEKHGHPTLPHYMGRDDELADRDRDQTVFAREEGATAAPTAGLHFTPNPQDGLRRLPYRLTWDDAFRRHVAGLAVTKPVIFCGDLNVAHQEIDIARPKENRFSAGFSDEERASFGELLNAGFTDTFRHFHPDKKDAYFWWSFHGVADASGKELADRHRGGSVHSPACHHTDSGIRGTRGCAIRRGGRVMVPALRS